MWDGMWLELGSAGMGVLVGHALGRPGQGLGWVCRQGWVRRRGRGRACRQDWARRQGWAGPGPLGPVPGRPWTPGAGSSRWHGATLAALLRGLGPGWALCRRRRPSAEPPWPRKLPPLQVNSIYAVYAGPVMFEQNAADVPAMVRVTDYMWAAFAHQNLNSFCGVGFPISNYSLPLSLAHEMGCAAPGVQPAAWLAPCRPRPLRGRPACGPIPPRPHLACTAPAAQLLGHLARRHRRGYAPVHQGLLQDQRRRAAAHPGRAHQHVPRVRRHPDGLAARALRAGAVAQVFVTTLFN
jgi:hypothetical protein